MITKVDYDGIAIVLNAENATTNITTKPSEGVNSHDDDNDWKRVMMSENIKS